MSDAINALKRSIELRNGNDCSLWVADAESAVEEIEEARQQLTALQAEKERLEGEVERLRNLQKAIIECDYLDMGSRVEIPLFQWDDVTEALRKTLQPPEGGDGR